MRAKSDSQERQVAFAVPIEKVKRKKICLQVTINRFSKFSSVKATTVHNENKKKGWKN